MNGGFLKLLFNRIPPMVIFIQNELVMVVMDNAEMIELQQSIIVLSSNTLFFVELNLVLYILTRSLIYPVSTKSKMRLLTLRSLLLLALS